MEQSEEERREAERLARIQEGREHERNERERRDAERQAHREAVQARRERDKDLRAEEKERTRQRLADERELARQRQIGIGWLAFKAGFFGALGVAVASPVIAVLAAIFWLFVFSAIMGG